MKKEKLFKVVAKAIKAVVEGEKLDKQAIAVALMTDGASLAMVNRELPKALAANGIVTDTGSLKVVRDAVKEGWYESDDENAEELEVTEWQDILTWSEELAEQFSVPTASCIKIIKTALGDKAPSRPKLGKVKSGIINYLISYPKGNIKGLADFLQKGTDLTAEKALREARMNYTFAKACYDANKA